MWFHLRWPSTVDQASPSKARSPSSRIKCQRCEKSTFVVFFFWGGRILHVFLVFCGCTSVGGDVSVFLASLEPPAVDRLQMLYCTTAWFRKRWDGPTSLENLEGGGLWQCVIFLSKPSHRCCRFVACLVSHISSARNASNSRLRTQHASE